MMQGWRGPRGGLGVGGWWWAGWLAPLSAPLLCFSRAEDRFLVPGTLVTPCHPFVFCLLLLAASPHVSSQWGPLRLAGPLAAYHLGLVVLTGAIFSEATLVGTLQSSGVSSFLGCPRDK